VSVTPSPEAFRELARDHTVVPVWREVLADFETPMSAYVKLVGTREGFLLESVEHAEHWGRFSFLGRDPARTFVTRGRHVEWLDGEPPPPGVPTDEGTLAALEALCAHYRAPKLPELPPFHGGIVGWLGYDTVREIERLPDVPYDDMGFPDAVCSLAGQRAEVVARGPDLGRGHKRPGAASPPNARKKQLCAPVWHAPRPSCSTTNRRTSMSQS